MNRLHLFLVAGLAACLTACATAQPYWENQTWAGELFKSVQAGLRYPPEADPKAMSVEATVQFTYTDGRLQDADLMKSTGSKTVDAAILEQVANIHAPAPRGSEIDVPHRFQMDVHLATPVDDYLAAMQHAIKARVFYPRGASFGRVMVGFDYHDGTPANVTVTQSGGSISLDKAAAEAVAATKLPPLPDFMKGTTHYDVVLCYGSNSFCGVTKTVIRISDDSKPTPATSP